MSSKLQAGATDVKYVNFTWLSHPDHNWIKQDYRQITARSQPSRVTLTWGWDGALLNAGACSPTQPRARRWPHAACVGGLGHRVAVAVAGVTQADLAVGAWAGFRHR
jgi:hypothetical protein